ncbi:MAG: hypothetical protein LBD03_02730 [Methanobrevibacter sp.]|jgi:hypothetical protein|nr:hypothetical protein [Candidatus Methanovirga procula]
MLIKKIIGLVIIILIVTVQSSAAVNNDTYMNTTAINENLTDENPTNLDTTYEYKKVSINPIGVNLDKIDDNWIGKYMWTDEFITKNLGKFSPPSVRKRKWYNFFGWLVDCIRYGFYCIAYALGCIIMALGWLVYSIAWLLVTIVWSVYAVIMTIANKDKTDEFVDKLEKGSFFNTDNRNVTVTDPEKVMGESKSRELSKLSNLLKNYSPVDFEYSDIENDTDFNPDDPGILEYSILKDGRHLITKQNGTTPDRHNNKECLNYTYEDCFNNLNSTNLDKSKKCSDSINLNNCSDSTLLVNSSNSINCRNSTFLENCLSVTNSSSCNGCENSHNLSNCSNCNDCSGLSSCFNCKCSNNCFNSTNVFSMNNRHNENRRNDGFLVVLSTKNVLDVNGDHHKVPEPYYTMSDSELQELLNNATKSYNSFKEANEKFKKATIWMEVIGGIGIGVTLLSGTIAAVMGALGCAPGQATANIANTESVTSKPAFDSGWAGAKWAMKALQGTRTMLALETVAGASEIAAHIMTGFYFSKESEEDDYDDNCKKSQSEIGFRNQYKILVNNVN